MAGTSWMPRAVGRYSWGLRISWVRPERPSTNARANVHAAVTAYVVSSSARHERLPASAKPRHSPRPASTNATAVPGPTRASTYPARGANGRTGWRLACTVQCPSGGTTTAAVIRRTAMPRPTHGARSERAAGTRPTLGAGLVLERQATAMSGFCNRQAHRSAPSGSSVNHMGIDVDCELVLPCHNEAGALP